MLKSLGIVAGGIFIGAFGMEMIRKKYPEGLDKLYATINGVTAKAKKAFMEGYYNALKGEPARAA